MLTFDLTDLDHKFQAKPLLIGGTAMEFYGLRPSGDDIDFVVQVDDYEALAATYPEQTRHILGDKGIAVGKYELWTSICLFDYDYLSQNALEKTAYRIISLEKLLLLKSFRISEAKHLSDLKLIVEKILNIQYGKDTLPA